MKRSKDENIMRIIGITGGVGAGKSTVLSYMEKHCGAVICQADKTAHELEEPGEECYSRIVAQFGNSILSADGTIDRKRLGSIVFGDRVSLEKLNAIVHPAVKDRIQMRIREEKGKGTELFVIEAALLIEDHYDEICDELWYIYADEDVRRRRLKETRGYSDERIDGILKSQKSEEEFRTHCHVTVDNSGDMEETCIQIKKALQWEEMKNSGRDETR
ncbi:dephospho-CoA kinase [Sellimonas caecigallum]|nr:dephospho-CoA kinase [Sellimonas caecigallum]